MDLHFLILLLSLVCFVLAAFGVNARQVNLTATGLALLVLSMLL
jgi:hypothetical protein